MKKIVLGGVNSTGLQHPVITEQIFFLYKYFLFFFLDIGINPKQNNYYHGDEIQKGEYSNTDYADGACISKKPEKNGTSDEGRGEFKVDPKSRTIVS